MTTTQDNTSPRSKIVPCLWFDNQAVEAGNFYAAVFPDSHVDRAAPIPADTPSGPEGSVQIVELTIAGQSFMAINAGPLFKLNPSISFFVTLERGNIDDAWRALSAGGKVLMPIDKYPFSERYGWVEDKYGVSWQLILNNPAGDWRPPLVPSLMFTGKNAGRAEEAIDYYLSVFKNTKRGQLVHYGAGQAPDQEGTVAFADFMVENQWLAAMDSAREHGFTFNEAVSLMVLCEDQEEIDYYFGKLSAVPEAEQCGWVKDRFGVSWQITPVALHRLMKDPDERRAKRVTEAMLKMKKLDIAALERA